MEQKYQARMCYTEVDNRDGRLSVLCERLSLAVHLLTGEEFLIFQDSNIEWGKVSQVRIREITKEVRFFIPVITPSFFNDRNCLEELKLFLVREQSRGYNLILPIYYIECPLLEHPASLDKHPLAQSIKARRYIDWRHLRLVNFDSPQVTKTLEYMSAQVRDTLHQILPSSFNESVNNLKANPQQLYTSIVHLFNESILKNPLYQQYTSTEATQELIEKVLQQPGYYVIESPIGTGKTALVAHLWRLCHQDGRPVALYMFQRETDHNSVQEAINACSTQLETYRNTNGFEFDKKTPLEDILLQINHLKPVILLDGLDASDDGERILLPQLLPDHLSLDVTFVITTRPLLYKNILAYLPEQHLLRQELGVSFQLPPLTPGYIRQFLRDLKVQRNEQPVWNTIEAFWEHMLQETEQKCPPDYKDLCRDVVVLIASAKSNPTSQELVDMARSVLGISWNSSVKNSTAQINPPQEMRPIFTNSPGAAELNNSLPEQLQTVLAALSHIITHQSDGRLAFVYGSDFREYVRQHKTFGEHILRTTAQLRVWVCEYIRAIFETRQEHLTTIFQNIPMYILLHGPEYLAEDLADHPLLWKVLVNRDWSDILQQRTGTRKAWRNSVLHTWLIAERIDTANTEPIQVVTILICVLLETACTTQLLYPEFVAMLYAFDFWTDEQTMNYAVQYVAPWDLWQILETLSEQSDNQRLPDYREDTQGIIRYFNARYPFLKNVPEAIEQLILIKQLLHSLQLDQHLTNQLVDIWIRKWELLSPMEPGSIREQVDRIFQEERYHDPYTQPSAVRQPHSQLLTQLSEVLKVPRDEQPDISTFDESIFDEAKKRFWEELFAFQKKQLPPANVNSAYFSENSLEDYLYALVDAWRSVKPSDAPLYFSFILRILPRQSYINILNALLAFTPALTTQFSSHLMQQMYNQIQEILEIYF